MKRIAALCVLVLGFAARGDEGMWTFDNFPSAKVKVTGKSGISQARSRLGSEPVKKLYDAVVAPIAEKRTKGSTVAGSWMFVFELPMRPGEVALGSLNTRSSSFLPLSISRWTAFCNS